jgi:hypothetical protein
MRNWWQRFLVWLGFSEPGLRREELEDWIDANAAIFAQIHADQATTRSPRGDHRQIRKQDRFLSSMPAWAEFQIDVYEAPLNHHNKTTYFGYTFGCSVTELDGTKWILRIDPEVIEDPVWVEVSRVSIP